MMTNKQEFNFENQNPTDAEVKLYRYGGFYLVNKSEQVIEYVSVHVESYPDFPYKINDIDREYIEFDNFIRFYMDCEVVRFSSHIGYDKVLLDLVQLRMNELGW